MKRIVIISVLIFTFGHLLIAQTITITKSYELSNETKISGFYPSFNLSGNKLLFSSDGYNGLSMYDFSTNTVNVISNEAGAGYEPMFGADDTKIFYRKTSYINNRKFDAIESYNISDRKKTVMLSPKRDVKQARNFHNGFIVTAERKLIKSTFGKTTLKMPVYVTTQDLKIYLYINNNFTILNPLNQAESRYLWVSLSPNEKMILFTAAGKGTYICDLNGKIISSLGYMNAPVWYDDNFVVGMQDKDDGHVITASKIVMISSNGKTKSVISQANEVAMYPTTSVKASKIAYNTLEGKIKVVEITVK